MRLRLAHTPAWDAPISTFFQPSMKKLFEPLLSGLSPSWLQKKKNTLTMEVSKGAASPLKQQHYLSVALLITWWTDSISSHHHSESLMARLVTQGSPRMFLNIKHSGASSHDLFAASYFKHHSSVWAEPVEHWNSRLQPYCLHHTQLPCQDCRLLNRKHWNVAPTILHYYALFHDAISQIYRCAKDVH